MLKYTACLLFIITFQFVEAQGWQPVGARSMSLANASVALTDVWSFHHNPGALANLDKVSVGVSYENRYLLKELQTQAFVVAHPLKKGVLSLGGQFYGHSLYRTNRVGLGYGLKLSDRISMGVQLNYQSIRITNYGQQGTVSGEFGFLGKITENVSVGFSVFNLNRAKLSSFQDDRFSTYMRLGLNYKVSSKVMVLAEAEKEIESKIRPKGAMEYQFTDLFTLRVGAAGNPMDVSFGFGFNFKKGIKFDFGTAWNQVLGWSPHFGLLYEFKTN